MSLPERSSSVSTCGLLGMVARLLKATAQLGTLGLNVSTLGMGSGLPWGSTLPAAALQRLGGRRTPRLMQRLGRAELSGQQRGRPSSQCNPLWLL